MKFKLNEWNWNPEKNLVKEPEEEPIFETAVDFPRLPTYWDFKWLPLKRLLREAGYPSDSVFWLGDPPEKVLKDEAFKGMIPAFHLVHGLGGNTRDEKAFVLPIFETKDDLLKMGYEIGQTILDKYTIIDLHEIILLNKNDKSLLTPWGEDDKLDLDNPDLPKNYVKRVLFGKWGQALVDFEKFKT